MGIINVEGLGEVQITGDKPNEEEQKIILETLEKMPASDKDINDKTDSFVKSNAFGRLAIEVGLGIGGSLLTGGAALPALALRAGFIARPFLAQLAKSSLGAAAGSGLKGAPKGKTPDKANTGGAALPAVGFLANELLADRKKAKLYDTPIEIIEKYIKRKKDVGAIKPGITTKGQLYDMAKIDLGEHIANNLIQYVVMEYGFTIPKNKTTEKEFVINFNKNNFNKKTP